MGELRQIFSLALMRQVWRLLHPAVDDVYGAKVGAMGVREVSVPDRRLSPLEPPSGRVRFHFIILKWWVIQVQCHCVDTRLLGAFLVCVLLLFLRRFLRGRARSRCRCLHPFHPSRY